MIPFIRDIRVGKSIEIESRLAVARAREAGREEITANGQKVSFSGDNNVLELVLMIAELCEYTKNH